ncbi:Gfo/Idh/MocA family oxidoreductase [[Ruminococcus] gnavus]|jgi:pyochelin biosynthetic protein PchG|uniref:Gfo/Idh/MocA family oxidoreductase n=1 Tax=Mediterraneibacter gnavus TaxID=33038 RepID=A0AAW6DLR7_MEDGN|nr:Gfo/Idh/MocA family oxidoreductase [Mediterraneibacter gnavus]MDU2006413.1 Gfo/Idh/MocA family oxidoreductase [Lachnospiraceae bacterium]MDU2934524.1 Gfo/Idh/MocA family oxidoreductase [Clostridiales bacterium]MDB8680959.1 Gfo/Idh/MocA family oxidoreductase [Mediterraneibacter gnavus]MDB8688017.1 Gfo/Idh/MocA family oxidoreductase [Mediterraneibacter gnavus]MDB8692115.1 Gfo/Idh/MocA family oxidoreductase [Mediterraneibacter gnavus]
MNKLRVVVCGTVFGRYYLEGIRKIPERYTLTGIFARGSTHSKQVAEHYGVPLFTDIEMITKENADIACVVVSSAIIGGNGTDLALNFLKKGIHVIQEHPVHLREYQKCLLMSSKNRCKYKLNTFYPDLLSIKHMICIVNKMREKLPIIFIRAECSVQLLFPMLDIISQVLGGLEPYQMEKLSGSLPQRFSVLSGTIRGVPIMLTIDNHMDLKLPESNLTMFHRIQIGTPSGTLMLTDTHGKLIWIPILDERLKKLQHGDNNYLAEIPIQEELGNNKPGTLGDIFLKYWPQCMANVLYDFYDDIKEKRYITQENQQMINVCKLWNTVGNLLGPYKTDVEPLNEPVDLDEFLKGINNE